MVKVQISQFSLNCPHCKKEIESGWGTADGTSLPDRFSCPYCHQPVELSDDVRIGRIAMRKTRGFLITFFVVSFLLGIVVRKFARGYTGSPLGAQEWAIVVAISLVLGLMISVIIHGIRKAITHDRLMAELRASKEKRT